MRASILYSVGLLLIPFASAATCEFRQTYCSPLTACATVAQSARGTCRVSEVNNSCSVTDNKNGSGVVKVRAMADINGIRVQQKTDTA
ncbi:hypothetical protein VTL71DRAFT_3622 [Oculimacula yallundae]|uniref:Uncharacterized protein n=1 Tax=Oculimacula yallundae TaxID=86028 RepID=A0ABR4C8F9_9HELO